MCLFCQIVENKISAYKIYEDDDCLAFLDIFPRALGHTLVIPKKHYEKYSDMTEEDVAKLGKVVFKVANRLQKKLNVPAYNIFNNNGKISGQEIMHVHFHILPRSENDGVNFLIPPVMQEAKNEIEKIYNSIVK